MSPASRLAAIGRWRGTELAAAILLQWISTLAVALRADRDGWRFEQGNDAFAAVQGAFRLVDGELPREGTALLWPILLSPLASIADTVDGVLAGAVLLNMIVLGPVALVAAYWLAARIGGRLLGRATIVLWLLGPWLLFAVALQPYDGTVRDRVLPLVLGLTAEPSYPAAVALICAAALVAHSLGRQALGLVALAGLSAGAAVAIEPSSLLFVAAGAAAYVTAARLRESAIFALTAAPAVVALALWEGVAGTDALSFGPVVWEQFSANMAGLREYFWSQRFLQWLPLAGTVAVARRSIPLATLLGGSVLALALVEGSGPSAGIDGGGMFRALLPALPAYVVLVAAVPLLVPTLARRLAGRLEPLEIQRRPGWRTLAAAGVVLAALPLAAAASGS